MPGAQAITWMFAALSTMEPPILDLSNRQDTRGAISLGPRNAFRWSWDRVRVPL